jgi:hypothetical protein
MKRIVASFLMIAMVSTSSICARESISELGKQTDDLYRTGAGAQDGAYTALAISMLGWGVGLAVLFAVLAAALNHSPHTSSSNAHCH